MHNTILATFTITEFRAFKKALAILCRAGMSIPDAVATLIDARDNRRRAA